jgi:hypothetical protein
VLSGGGEPPTRSKVDAIERSGARHLAGYSFAEGGAVGLACAAPLEENDHHFAADGLALIQHPHQVGDVEVPAFHFTSLHATTPKVLLNAESDDFGVVEERRCGCALEALGYSTHVRRIRSYRKLTGEGMTLVGTDMERILGELLPARFGGGSLDYQLLEEETPAGRSKLALLVDPRVELRGSAAEVVAARSSCGAKRRALRRWESSCRSPRSASAPRARRPAGAAAKEPPATDTAVRTGTGAASPAPRGGFGAARSRDRGRSRRRA